VNHAPRSLILDNAKYIMIFMVVLGHTLSPFIYTFPTLKTAFIILYSFHMPVFIIISGMLSRDTFSFQLVKKLLRTLIIPFVIFSLIYEISHFIMFKETSDYLKWRIPHWLLWYLPSLFFWRLTLPFISKIPLFLLLSLIGAILIGFVRDIHEMLGLARTFYFWPFFLLGYTLTPDFFHSEKWQRIPKFIWALFLLGTFTLISLKWDISHKLLYGNLPYVEFDFGVISAPLIRLCIILASAIISLAIIGLVPRKLPVLPHWKINTMPIYLWHGIAINIFIVTGVKDTMKAWPLFGLSLALLFFAILLTLLLSSKFSAIITRYITFQPSR